MWIIVMSLLAAWRLILTAPIHCRRSSGECLLRLPLFLLMLFVSKTLEHKSSHRVCSTDRNDSCSLQGRCAITFLSNRTYDFRPGPLQEHID